MIIFWMILGIGHSCQRISQWTIDSLIAPPHTQKKRKRKQVPSVVCICLPQATLIFGLLSRCFGSYYCFCQYPLFNHATTISRSINCFSQSFYLIPNTFQPKQILQFLQYMCDIFFFLVSTPNSDVSSLIVFSVSPFLSFLFMVTGCWEGEGWQGIGRRPMLTLLLFSGKLFFVCSMMSVTSHSRAN